MFNPAVTQQGLVMLTQLSRLQRLDVDRNDEVTDTFMDSLLPALPGGAWRRTSCFNAYRLVSMVTQVI